MVMGGDVCRRRAGSFFRELRLLRVKSTTLRARS